MAGKGRAPTFIRREFYANRPTLKNEACCLTVCVTHWWVGRDNVALTEPASSHTNCSKTRRLPPVGCTLCSAAVSLWRKFCIKYKFIITCLRCVRVSRLLQPTATIGTLHSFIFLSCRCVNVFLVSKVQNS